MFLKNKNKNSDGKPKRFFRKRGWKITFLVLGVIILLFGAYVAYVYASGKRIFDPGSLMNSPFFKSIAGKDYELRGEGDGRINILFLGMGGANHPGGTLTDTIMVVSIDPENKNMAMMSIPRDIYYPVEEWKTTKINELYQTGEKIDKGGGAKFAKEQIGELLDLPIHYYMVIDFYAFVEIIDELNGIDISVAKDLYDPEYPAENMIDYDPFYLKAGDHHLDGETALKYARSRKGTSGGDFGRAARQQEVIQAVKEKAFKLGYLANPKNILDTIDVISEHVRTDFSPKEIYAFSDLLKGVDTSTIASKVLTNGADGELYSCGNGIFCPINDDWGEIQRITHEIFQDPNLIQENAKIEVLNGTSIVGLATKLSKTLESYNYNVVNVGNSENNYQKTVIFDYSKGEKKITLQFLQKRLDADIVKKGSSDKDVDLRIIIGEDYQGFTSADKKAD